MVLVLIPWLRRAVWLWLFIPYLSSAASYSAEKSASLNPGVAKSDWKSIIHDVTQYDRRRLQQVSVIDLSPRRNPFNGFRKYENGLVLRSMDYWVATLWEGWPFLLAAAVWIVSTFIFIIVRCVFLAKGEGFLPSSRSRHGHERSVSVVYFALVVIQLAALTTFFVYGVLSYRAGMNLAQRLELSYPAVQDQVSDVRNSAHGLQGVINGTQRIAGSSMSSAFEPSPPDLDSPSQAMINDLETVNSVASGSVRKLERVYEALLAFIGVSAFVTLIFLLLAGGGCVWKNRRLMQGCLTLLPMSSILLWCSGALLYGVLLNEVDLCNSLSGFLATPDQQATSQIRVDLLPCPATAEASALKASTTQTLFNLTRAANDILEDPPLLCESYTLDPDGNSTETLVSCPFPTSQHMFTHHNWESNTASLKCNGNNNTLCAVRSTPLIQSTYTTTVQLLQQVEIAESLLEETEVIASCIFASDAALTIWKDTCKSSQLKAPLMGAWITCTIAAACGLLLAPVLLITISGAKSTTASQVDVVYNPGYNSLPLKSTAAGYNTQQTEYVAMGTMGVISNMGTANSAGFAFHNASTMSSGDLLSPPSTAGLDGFLTMPGAFLTANVSPPTSKGPDNGEP